MNPRSVRYNMHDNSDRIVGGFFFPFLLGGLAGGAAVGLTRPRPIYNVAPQYYGPNPYYNAPYYHSSYSYYRPVGYPYYY